MDCVKCNEPVGNFSMNGVRKICEKCLRESVGDNFIDNHIKEIDDYILGNMDFIREKASQVYYNRTFRIFPEQFGNLFRDSVYKIYGMTLSEILDDESGEFLSKLRDEIIDDLLL